MTTRARLGALTALAIAIFALLVSSAAAAPWWHLDSNLRPATLPTGGEGTLVLRASNLGNSCTASEVGPDGEPCSEDDEAVQPTTISATLPAGTEVVQAEGVPQVEFWAFSKGEDLGPTGFIGGLVKYCKVSGQLVTCRTQPTEPPFDEIPFLAVQPLKPYEWLEVRIKVKDAGATPGAKVEAEVAGGGASTVSRAKSLPIGPDATEFGTEEYSLVPEEEGGLVDTRAGAHPYQLTTTFALNQKAQEGSGLGSHVNAPALPRNLHFRLPPGQLGNPTALPQCGAVEFSSVPGGGVENLCPASTVIGVASISFDEQQNLGLKTFPVPLFNLVPAPGEPARFGFTFAQAPVILDTAIRSGPGEDYGVTVTVRNITQVANLLSSTVTFWGTPGDPSHGSSRGWNCLIGGHWRGENGGPCQSENQHKPPAFLTLPTNCAAPFVTTVEGESWTSLNHPVASQMDPFTYSLEDGAGNLLPLSACNQVPFSPRIHSEPTSDAATSATGLSFEIDVDDEGLGNAEGLAQSQIKKAVVTLPEGFTTNPSVAEGLKACTEAEFEATTMQGGTGCTEESKIGDVEIESPLVEPKVLGSLFVAKQHDNPYSNLLTIYLVARNPEVGVLIKQALKVTPDPSTGQLTTEVDSIPQLPFSHFQLSFRQGQRSPLITPAACGTYTVEADLYPWSVPSAPVHRESSFQITQGPEGQPCPTGGTPPFHPNLEAGTVNNLAGSHSPFYVHMTRKDSEQEITHFSIKLPPGVAGTLAGIPYCPDGAIAAAKAREHEGGGSEEEAAPSCPANSEVGHTLVGSGVGNVLAYAPGHVYLAGPYNGSNLSLVSITAAKVGPFDLGTVVVRFALRIDPETAEVFVDAQGSDPIPHIVDGIPVHLRDIRTYVDRPDFVLNPTSCARTSTASTVLGSGLDFVSEADDQPVTVTSPFQAADCAALNFKPTLKLSLKGGTKRGATPAFKAVLTFPKGNNANIAESQVTLPHSEFLEQSHIGTVCTRPQFKAGKVPGEKCPAASVYGRAEAITPILSEPLSGPVYLRSSSHPLPDLVAALHNSQVDIALAGRIDSVQNGRIRNSFEAVPDAPVSKFVLEMKGGNKGLLVNSTNICKSKNRALSHFVGQNGKVYDTKPVLKAKCGKKAKKAKSKKGKRAARAGG